LQKSAHGADAVLQQNPDRALIATIDEIARAQLKASYMLSSTVP
jgi:hypothetical protein